MPEKLLEVRGLKVAFKTGGGEIVPVRGVSFAVPRGGRVAIVGESGCGKSLTALAITRLPPVDRANVEGEIVWRGAYSPSGRPRISYVFQLPMETLDPVMRVGAQIAEALPREHRRDAPRRVAALLARTGLPERAARAYPCELSGGQCQRAVLAMALAADPELLIADEPTTALDVTTQRQVLDLIEELRAERGMAVLLITHNLGLVAGRMDEVNVMYAGEIVESGAVAETLRAPRHPYTKGLLGAVPSLDGPASTRLRDIPGTVPPPDAWPIGCAFRERCGLARAECSTDAYPCRAFGTSHAGSYKEEKP